MLLELGLEAREEREGVGGRAREARQHAVVVQLAHLARARLHDRLAERHLAVARHRHLAAVAHARRTVVAWNVAAPVACVIAWSAQVARGWACVVDPCTAARGLTCV